METGRRRRRWWTLSVRSLLLLVLVTGGWLGWKARQARQQRAAVAAIVARGGFVLYDWQWDEACPYYADPSKRPWAPRWLRRALGDEPFQEVTLVQVGYNPKHRPLAPSPDDEAVLDHLAGLRGIRCLELGPALATDRGMERIGRLTRLERLVMDDAWRLTDAGLAHLRGLRYLRSLHIGRAHITERSLGDIGSFSKLERLTLEFTRIRFSDARLAHLRGLTCLKYLSLGWADEVSDDGLAHLGGMAELDSLAIVGSRVTDEGLKHLRGLTKLEQLSLPGSGVTDEGLKRLQATAPSLRIGTQTFYQIRP
jgi:hypothetical protein